VGELGRLAGWDGVVLGCEELAVDEQRTRRHCSDWQAGSKRYK
jgi:hypothetical protein